MDWLGLRCHVGQTVAVIVSVVTAAVKQQILEAAPDFFVYIPVIATKHLEQARQSTDVLV